jgi:molecular chaperone HscA
MKAVQEAVQTFFGKTLNNTLNPDEVVAMGAAIQADVLAGNNKDILLLDITPLSLGIETVGGLMDTIIARNTKVPIKAGRQYTTSVDGQKNLKVAVYQGERDMIADNRKLGEFVLRGIPPMPAGIPKIEIHFLLNADGIMKVRAKELRSGVEQTVEMKPTYGISEEEMGKMLLDSIKNAKEDMATRALIEARTEANNVLLSTGKFMVQNKAILSEEEINQTKKLAFELEQSTKGEDKDAIHKAMENLNEYTTPMAHRALDHNIAEAMKGKKV